MRRVGDGLLGVVGHPRTLSETLVALAQATSQHVDRDNGARTRLMGCTLAISERRIISTFNAHPRYGWQATGGRRFADVMRDVVQDGPCMFLEIGQRTLLPEHVFMTHDARAALVGGSATPRRVDCSLPA